MSISGYCRVLDYLTKYDYVLDEFKEPSSSTKLEPATASIEADYNDGGIVIDSDEEKDQEFH